MTYNENLDVCPITKETWEKRAEEKSVDCALFKRFNNRNDLFPSLLILKYINYSHDRSFYRLLSHLYK